MSGQVGYFVATAPASGSGGEITAHIGIAHDRPSIATATRELPRRGASPGWNIVALCESKVMVSR